MRGTPLARRPCESRDPYAVPFRSVQAFRPNERRWLWVPAFAGTTQEDSIVKQQTRLRPRDAMRPSRAFISRPIEGVGNAGCPLHPQPRVQCVGSTRVSSPQVHRDHPAFPHAMVLTAYFVLSPVTGLFCHRRPRTNVAPKPGRADITSANLTPASGRQDHATSPYATTSFVSSPFDRSQVFQLALPSRCAPNAAASTASHPASLTIRIRPSVGRDARSSRSDLG